jgi:hypothetical protein
MDVLTEYGVRTAFFRIHPRLPDRRGASGVAPRFIGAAFGFEMQVTAV